VPLISEILAKPDDPTNFLLEPYIVRGGITFLHGDTSIGKSPLTWEVARCLAQGRDWLGLSTNQCRVLYLEADTPESTLRTRLRSLTSPIGEWRIEFLTDVSMNLCDHEHRIFKVFHDYTKRFGPFDLVIWNTLRQFYQGSAIDSEVPQKVYKALRLAFPDGGTLGQCPQPQSLSGP